MVFTQICSYVDLLVRGIEVRLPEVVFFGGGVGSGKGTARAFVQKNYPFYTIDTTDVLKEAAEKNDEIKEKMEKAELITSDTVVNLIAHKMDENPN